MSGEDMQQRGVVRPSPKEAVMRTLMAVVALAVGMLVYATLPAAADEKADQKAAGKLMEAFQDLNLTDEQEAKIAGIRKENGPKVQEAGKELAGIVKEEMEKVQAVLTPDQKKKLEEAKEERKEHRGEGLAQKITNLEKLDLTEAEIAKIADIRKEFRPKTEKAMQELGGILSDEQKKARQEALTSGKNRKEMLEALKLTDDQKAKVAAVCKTLGDLVRTEVEQIKDALDEEQKTQLAELKDERKERARDRLACMIANLKDLNLTDEQKTQIGNIRKEYRAKVHEAGNKTRAAVREEVEAIVAVIKA
jgi:Spy/CpxP family protein refolding chaperone